MTQQEKVLKALEDRRGEWISGEYFLRTLFLSQYHARLKELEEKGVKIEHSNFTNDYGFKSYRLALLEPQQQTLI
jgi:biotin operon repressor